MINLKQYLIDRIKEYDADIDTSPGSNVRDILIDPLSQMLDGYQDEHERVLSRFSISNLGEISTAELDAVALNFFVERNQGVKSTGTIKLYFTEPQATSIPKGSKFTTTDGVVVETSSTYTISRVQMQGNIDRFPLYGTGDINVAAVLPGSSGNLSLGTTLTTASSIPNTPSRIEVSSNFSGGVNTETNEQFYNRIVNTIFNQSLLSPNAIDSKVKTQQTSVKDVQVVGAGHPQMLRDLTTFYDGGNYQFEDYLYTYSGTSVNSYNKANKAFYGLFTDTDPSDDVAIPGIGDFNYEFTDSMYQGVYLKDDSNYASVEEYSLINDIGTDFSKNDGAFRNQELKYDDEIVLISGIATLGKTVSENDEVIIDVIESELEQIKKDIENGNLVAATEFIELLTGEIRRNNLSPIIHKKLDRHAGIEINVDMSTTDGTENGEMTYITVLRNDTVFSANDGFGIAWRKQPAYLIRIDNETHTQADLDKFKEEWGVDATNYIGDIQGNSQFWKYNVYLVDNNVLDEEVYIQGEQILNQEGGVNQFLATAKVWMVPETNYSFKTKIYETFAVECWVYETSAPPGEFTTANRTIYRGATYPNFIPSAGEVLSFDNGIKAFDYTRGHFGIGVGQTRNYEWTVSNLSVETFIEIFPMQLFRFYIDESKFTTTDPFSIEYYGTGFDPTESPEAEHSKVKLAVYNTNTSQWEEVGTHLKGPSASRDEQIIEKRYLAMTDYIDNDNHIHFIALAVNSGSLFPDDTQHKLRSYYIKLDNDLQNKVHRGNAVDTYCFDPDNFKVATVTHTLGGQNETTSNITGFPGYAIEILEIRESISGNVIDESTYSLYTVAKGEEYGSNGDYRISFTDSGISGTLIEIDVLYWTAGTAVNTYLNSSSVSYPAIDMISKAMPVARVVINRLEFSGNLNLDTAKLSVLNYINNNSLTTIDKSDIVDVLYDTGATFVNLDMDIFIYQKRYNFETAVFEFVGQTYTIPFNSVSRLFTRLEDLEGMELV